MPASAEIKGNIVELLWTGVFHPGDVTKSLNEAVAMVSGRENACILIKDQVKVLHFGAAEAWQVANALKSMQQDGIRRIGMVAGKPVHFGIGRMINAHCEMVQVVFEVFWDEKNALNWLRSDNGCLPKG